MKTFYVFTLFRERFVDICDGKVGRGGMTVMRDISSVVGGDRRKFASEEQIVNKIQDILWDEVFQRYFLHPNVIFKFNFKRRKRQRRFLKLFLIVMT